MICYHTFRIATATIQFLQNVTIYDSNCLSVYLLYKYILNKIISTKVFQSEILQFPFL